MGSCEWAIALVSVVIGFLLGLLPPYFSRRGRIKAHFAALKCEIEICGQMAQTYLTDNIKAPLYRLPINTYENSLPALLADGALSADEITGITKYYTITMDLNRGLGNADFFLKKENNKLLETEYRRNRMKAEGLASGVMGNQYSRALELLEARK